MLNKLQLQDAQAAVTLPDRRNTQNAAHDCNSTEPLPEETLQLAGLHSTAQGGSDYLTPAGSRWAAHKVLPQTNIICVKPVFNLIQCCISQFWSDLSCGCECPFDSLYCL